MTKQTLRRLVTPLLAVSAMACVDLDVPNLNNPDRARALASPEDVASVAAGSIYTWYYAATWEEAAMMQQVTADAATGNYGNFGMRFNNLEPRIPYENNSAGGDRAVTESAWEEHYKALGGANDALTALLINGVELDTQDETDAAVAAALFAQAGSLMNLALIFNQAFIVDENTVGVPTMQPYTTVRDAALDKWDALIALTDGATWSWDPTWLPMTAGSNAAMINRLAKTMAARTLVLSARTAAENAATDWARVLAYADEGITGTGLTSVDFSLPYSTEWVDYIKMYGNLDSWTRVDRRLARRMAPNVVAPFVGIDSTNRPVPTDNRMGLANLPCGANPAACLVGVTNDFVYLETVIGDPGRGIWMQSDFYHQRWRNVSFSVPSAQRLGNPMVYVLAAENDLMIAEALARLNQDLPRAAALVNNTRVTRGGLAPVAAVQADILAAINYERDVELLNTSGLSLWDRRRVDGLQNGTLRHLPVPAKELEILGLPVYTFGGVGQPDM